MIRRPIVAFGFVFTCMFASAFAAMSEWTDLQGTSFKGEPQGIYGPYALFKTGEARGRRVLVTLLSPEDCVRFYRATAGKGERAADWSKSKSTISYDLKGRVRRLEKGVLVQPNLKGLPEPELYVLLYTTAWGEAGWGLPWHLRATYDRLRRLYGNQMEVVYFGVKHGSNDELNFVKGTNMPWLVADFDSRFSCEVFKDFKPENDSSTMVLITRQGVPLSIRDVESLEGRKLFLDDLCSTIASADELNPYFWKARAYYQASIRPVQFVDKSAPPLLVWNPMRASLLRQKNIDRIIAKLEIAEDGSVTSVGISNDMSPGIARALEKVLKSNLVFLPAIDHGKPVAASYDFDYMVPDAKKDMEVDRDWVVLSGRKEVPLPYWLLLRPIPVPSGMFSKVDHEEADGTMVFTPVVIGKEKVGKKAQMNAFNTDFFGSEGAGTLSPFAGKEEVIEENKYKWERYGSPIGWVDMRTKGNCDYSIGYAWTEFEVTEGGLAYFGIGSNDGVRIWLNGKLVLDKFYERSTLLDQDIVPVQLDSGKNTILIKIQNIKEAWSFFCRLRR
jgi:hypothetical protein